MEDTGSYWKPVYNLLEAAGLRPIVGNASHMKAVPGRKTDTQDAEWICGLHRHGLIKASFIPPRAQRELREPVGYRSTLIAGVLGAASEHPAKMMSRDEVEALLRSAGLEPVEYSATDCLLALPADRLAALEADRSVWPALLEAEVEACRRAPETGGHLLFAARRPGAPAAWDESPAVTAQGATSRPARGTEPPAMAMGGPPAGDASRCPGRAPLPDRRSAPSTPSSGTRRPRPRSG